MNLIVDIGNTQIKSGFFENNQLVRLENSTLGETEFVSGLLSKCENAPNVIISSVRKYPEELISKLKLACKVVLFFNSEIGTPLENLYESKSTLGYDRLAACAGAHGLYKGKDILVIDAGTAITFDFVTAKAQYLGGCISPGLKMRFKALHEFTQNLPELSKNEDFSLIGKNTNDAIVSGVQNGLIFEIDSYINKLKTIHPELRVVITGGDAHFLNKSLDNKAAYHPEIVLEGLNKILEFNLLIHS
ncbi:type III pantothenate kinase [Labilibaculum manganireducens]|uniref:type III pantothenate kinase n=1 Tax=Labilibaculum manganireducens TaxID=1940525 RepID=UPI0029F4911B|nr:type III pantothenate kinase [Labilibaculum manganireducens]